MMKKRKNNRAAGCRGELACRDQFRKFGFTARRSAQYCGQSGEAADVIVEELPWLHIESKSTEKKNFLDWLNQAERDTAGTGKVPLVCHKRDHRLGWIAILPLDRLMEMITALPLDFFLGIAPDKGEFYQNQTQKGTIEEPCH